jgi:hypothetical protein
LFTGASREQKQKTSIKNSNLEILIEKALKIDDKVFIELENEDSVCLILFLLELCVLILDFNNQISDTSDCSTPTVTEQPYEGKDVNILAEVATIYKNKLNTQSVCYTIPIITKLILLISDFKC